MDQLNSYLRKNDSVMVMVGKEKGKTGKILMFVPKKSRALIEKLKSHLGMQVMRQSDDGAVYFFHDLMIICIHCLSDS